jgi:transcriptional regulator with GAF, ATPase, and Fis domain
MIVNVIHDSISLDEAAKTLGLKKQTLKGRMNKFDIDTDLK